MPTIKIEAKQFHTKKQIKLLRLLNDKDVRKQINIRLKDAINEYVPKKSGALRRSAIVTHNSISWGRGLPYARYQYYGEVYGPNFPIIKGGTIVGWRSPPGEGSKHPTGRELGVPGEWLGWKFGYTTPGTHHHWDKEFTYIPKMKANQEITRYLKAECKRRGLKV